MIKIIGAGMAGLLAANMLRRREPIVYEMQPKLPHNHSAVLRFRSSLVGEVLGIPFKKVRVIKSVLPWRNPVADAMAYSHKVVGEYRTDRSIMPGTSIEERWIAPPDLIERMSEGINVKYETEFDFAAEETKVISTIPMPNLMIVMGFEPRPAFSHVQGINLRATIRDCDAYLSLYIPDPELDFSRISVTGNEMIIEFAHDIHRPNRVKLESALRKALHIIGMGGASLDGYAVRPQRYQKIAPIDENERRNFVFWASTVKGKAFSLGRYATWRPGLLLDDIVKDIRLIDSWIQSPAGGYSMGVHHGRE